MLLFFCRQWFVQFALALVARVLEIFHERQTERVDECSQTGHRQVEGVSYGQDQEEHKIVYARHRNPVERHHSKVVESAAEHAAGQSEGIQTDVAQHVAEDAGHLVVGVPQPGSYIEERVAARCVEYEDSEC